MIALCEILKDMEENDVIFKTAGGSRLLKIRNVDFANQTFCFERSTGKISWPLSIEKFEALYNDVIENKINLDYRQFEKIVPTFGNYSAGLIKYIINKNNENG